MNDTTDTLDFSSIFDGAEEEVKASGERTIHWSFWNETPLYVPERLSDDAPGVITLEFFVLFPMFVLLLLLEVWNKVETGS